MYLVQKLSIAEIYRRTGFSRSTIAHWVESYEKEGLEYLLRNIMDRVALDQLNLVRSKNEMDYQKLVYQKSQRDFKEIEMKANVVRHIKRQVS